MKTPRHLLVAALGAVLIPHAAQALLPMTELGTAYTENFNSFTGVDGTLPANFAVSPAVVGMTYNGYYTRSDAYVNSSRIVALRDTPSSTDIAFGMKPASSGGVSTLDWSLSNATGISLSRFEVAWDFEQYSESGRASQVSLSYSINGGAFTTAGITGVSLSTAQTRPPATSPGAQNLASVRVESLSVAIDLSTLLAPDQTIVLRWSFTPGTLIGDSNNAAHVGVDNLSITAIPEPSTAIVAAFGAGVLVLLRRKRR